MHEKFTVSMSTTCITQSKIFSTHFFMLFIVYLWKWIQLSPSIGKGQIWQFQKTTNPFHLHSQWRDWE